MLFLKFKQFIAPKSFRFTDPDTKREFKGNSIQDLVTQVQGYRSQNDLEELEYLSTVIENFLCHLPIHAGSCMPVKNPKRSIAQYMRGGIATLKNIAYKEFVPQEEADRRSEICSRCPHNNFPDASRHFINWANDIAVRSVGDKKSSHHDKLGVCGLCSCPLRAKVFYKGKIKLSKEELSKMEALSNPPCWQPEFTK